MKHIQNVIKWIVLSIALGLICGAVGVLFHEALMFVTDFRTNNNKIIYFLPVAGVLITLFYSVFKLKQSSTLNIINSAKTQTKIKFMTVPLIFVSTLITHLFGGSAGREGAALQIGGGLGYGFGKVFKLDKKELSLIAVSGMGSVFCALFGTPVTAFVFALEVAGRKVLNAYSVMSCVISSFTAFYFAKAFNIHYENFGAINVPQINIDIIAKVVIFALFCALVGILFCQAILKGEHYSKKVITIISVHFYVAE